MNDILWKGVGIISFISAVFFGGVHWGGEHYSTPLRERITALEAANLAADAMAEADRKQFEENGHAITKHWSGKFAAVDAERKRLLMAMPKGNKDSQDSPASCPENPIQWRDQQTAFTLGCTLDAIVAEACKEYVTVNHVPVLE